MKRKKSKEKEQRAKSKEQRAKSKEQRLKNAKAYVAAYLRYPWPMRCRKHNNNSNNNNITTVMHIDVMYYAYICIQSGMYIDICIEGRTALCVYTYIYMYLCRFCISGSKYAPWPCGSGSILHSC
jgi:hypothetical protein